MDARRFRKDSAQRCAEFRWWGCVLLTMFALVQTARGAVGPTRVLEPIQSDSHLPLASAVCRPATHAVTPNAAIPVAAWDEAEITFMSDPLQGLIDPFGSARPVNATRIASATLNDPSAGDLRIQTP